MIPSYNFATEENVCFKHIWTPRVVVKQVSNRRHVFVVVCDIFLRPALEENYKTYTDAFLLFLSFAQKKSRVINSTKESKQKSAHMRVALLVWFIHYSLKKMQIVWKIDDQTQTNLIIASMRITRENKSKFSDQFISNHEPSLVSMVWAKSNSFWNWIKFNFPSFYIISENFIWKKGLVRYSKQNGDFCGIRTHYHWFSTLCELMHWAKRYISYYFYLFSMAYFRTECFIHTNTTISFTRFSIDIKWIAIHKEEQIYRSAENCRNTRKGIRN